MNRMVFRCDANTRCGHGHFARCYELAVALKEYHADIEISFLGQFTDHALGLLRENDLDVFEISAESTYSLQTVFDELQDPRDFLWVDSYLIDQKFVDGLTQRGARWGAFDDFHTLDLSGAQLVVNMRFGAEDWSPYNATKEGRGVRYMPFDDSFVKLREKNENQQCSDTVNNILVCLGGSDIHQVSLELSQCVAAAFPDSCINLVDPSGLCQNVPENVTLLPMQKTMVPLLEDCDLMVCGGGRLKYEAGFCAVPNVTVAQTEGQFEDSQILQGRGLTLSLGMAEKLDKKFVREQLAQVVLKDVRQAMRDEHCHQFDKNARKNLVDIVSYTLKG